MSVRCGVVVGYGSVIIVGEVKEENAETAEGVWKVNVSEVGLMVNEKGEGMVIQVHTMRWNG